MIFNQSGGPVLADVVGETGSMGIEATNWEEAIYLINILNSNNLISRKDAIINRFSPIQG